MKLNTNNNISHNKIIEAPTSIKESVYSEFTSVAHGVNSYATTVSFEKAIKGKENVNPEIEFAKDIIPILEGATLQVAQQTNKVFLAKLEEHYAMFTELDGISEKLEKEYNFTDLAPYVVAYGETIAAKYDRIIDLL